MYEGTLVRKMLKPKQATLLLIVYDREAEKWAQLLFVQGVVHGYQSRLDKESPKKGVYMDKDDTISEVSSKW